jgi:tetratricopeptide (TPR) repeat protein
MKRAQQNLGVATQQTGKCDASLVENITSAEARKTEGTGLFKQGDFAGALVQYEAAFTLVAESEAAGCGEEAAMQGGRLLVQSCALNAAACSLELKDNVKCVRYCTSVLKDCPSNVKALFRRGSAYVEMGEWEQAKCDLHEARRLVVAAGADDKRANRDAHAITKTLRILRQKKQEAKTKEKAAFGGFGMGGLFGDHDERL